MPFQMKRMRRTLTGMLTDFVAVILAYLGATAFLSFSDPDYARFAVPYQHIVLAAGGLVAALYLCGVYRRIWQRTSGYGMTILIYAVALASLVMIGLLRLLRDPDLPLQLIFLGNTFSLMLFVAVRYRSRLLNSAGWRWRALYRRGLPENQTRVLIIGAGESGQVLAWRLKHRFNDGNYQIVGFIDDDLAKQGLYVENSPVIGTRHDLIAMAEKHRIDLIVVAIHKISGPDFREILTLCEKTKALIKVVPNLQALVSAHHSTEALRDVQAEDLIGRSAISRYEGIDLAPVTGKCILITGAAGSIGSELSRQMMDYAPTHAILLDNNESGLHDLVTDLRTRHPKIALTSVLADITNRNTLAAIFAQHRPQVVFHAAAYKHVPMLEYYPAEALRVNVTGTRNLGELSQQYGVERFVLISTDKAVKPSSVMGASKRLCELILHALSHHPDNATYFAAVRFGNVLGSRGSVVPTFNRQIDNGGPVTVTHQEMTRYFMSIPEAVNLIIHAACLTTGDDIYVLQMGEVVRIVELAERMIRLRGLRPYQDIQIEFTGMRPGEKMHEELFNDVEEPSPTAHPHIMCVSRWGGDFQPATFFSTIDTLLAQTYLSGKAALADMSAIITPTESAAPVSAITNNSTAAAANGAHDSAPAELDRTA